uniref:RNA-dependent RNA polymerase n=1 Tax=Ascaris lumbricoides TaxID=6252 RepID=A0A0M3HJQ2_ASCLU
QVEDIFQFLWFGGLNPYDLYRDCDPNPDINDVRMSAIRRGLFPRKFLSEPSMKKHNTDDNNLISLRREHIRLQGAAPCLNDSDVVQYMNNKEVRNALHIPSNLPKWDICSDEVTTTYQKQYGDMSPFIKKILAKHIRVLLYYGDTDMACNFMMGQQFSAGLKLKVHFFSFYLREEDLYH